MLSGPVRYGYAALALALAVAAVVYAHVRERALITDILYACMETHENDFSRYDLCVRDAVRSSLADYDARMLLAAVVSPDSPPRVQQQCHFYGHVIGVELFNRTASLEESLAQCSAACRNACVHGSFAAAVAHEFGVTRSAQEDVAHGDVARLREIGKVYCTRPSLCHGVGHVAFGLSSEITAALDICDAVTVSALRECYEGVFMESSGDSMSLLGIESVVVDGTEVGAPCTNFEGKRQRACFRYLYPIQKTYYIREGTLDAGERLQASFDTCLKFGGRTSLDCIEGLAVFLEDEFLGNRSEIIDFCNRMSLDEYELSCLLGVVRRQIANRKYVDAVEYCARQEFEAVQDECLVAAFQWMATHGFGDGAIKRVCDSSQLPAICGARYAEYREASTRYPDYVNGD